MSRWLVLLITLLWGVFALFAVKWVGQEKFVEFDPYLTLSSSIMSLEFEQTVVNNLPDIPANSSGHIYHLVQSGCFCEKLSEGHKKQLNKWGSSLNISHQTLDLNDYPNLLSFIPSTPAVVVVNKNKALVYLGPYSVGFGCFEDTGLVDTKIQPHFDEASLLSQSPLRSQIQSEALGCYCSSEKR